MNKLYFFIIAALTVVLISCDKDPVDPPTDEPTILENLDNYSISAMAVDSNNDLWIGTNNGLFKKVTEGYLEIDLDIEKSVTTLAYESGINTLWMGTESGIYQLELGVNEVTATSIPLNFLSNDHILSSYIDENSNRWFGAKVGFTRSEGDTWQKDMFKKNSNGTQSDLNFSSESINSIGAWNGSYYFATNGNQLWRTSDWDDSVDAFTSASMWDFGYNGNAIADTMYAVFIDSRGIQWFGGQEGVQGHVGDNPKESNISFKDELVNKNVHCIAEAPNGNIWCGTENGISIGSVSLTTGVVWNASTASLSNNFVTSIIFQGNTAWVGTKMGLNKIDL